MADYLISTNLLNWIPGTSESPFIGWHEGHGEAEVIQQMQVGDFVIPKFAQKPFFDGNPDHEPSSFEVCSIIGADLEEQKELYDRSVNSGEPGKGATPLVWRVRRGPERRPDLPGSWVCVEVDLYWLEFPVSTQEFLRMRGIPLSVARQFKALTSPGKRIQEAGPGTGERVIAAGSMEKRSAELLKRMSLVEAGTVGTAEKILSENGMGPDPEDLVFVANSENMPGFFEADTTGSLVPTADSGEFHDSPFAVLELIEKADVKAEKSDGLAPRDARDALKDVVKLLEGPSVVEEWENFSYFYNGLVKLNQKASLALEIVGRPFEAEQSGPVTEPDEEEAVGEILGKLKGLTVGSVQTQMADIELPKQTVADAVTALRAGKHLLFSGSPGTGKSRLASAVCRAVVGDNYDISTATADWTTFDTIGGYMPTTEGALTFEEGVVLRALKHGNWLIIDEINRADIDKAFGPLFTVLSGASDQSGNGEEVVLPYRQAEGNIRIAWSSDQKFSSWRYPITPSWRLLGTLNVRDKASLFKLSYAFLRRFAVIDVPLPDEDTYRKLIGKWLQMEQGTERTVLLGAAMDLAHGPVRLGPAILKDVSAFTERALKDLEPSKQGPPYESAQEAFIAAVRLYAVPQYEGAPRSDGQDLVKALKSRLAQVSDESWARLEESLKEVTLDFGDLT